MTTLKVRNPHRSFEGMPPYWTAASIGHGDFQHDFLACVEWCARQGDVPTYLRNHFGMSPEPYGLPGDLNVGPEDAVVQRVEHAWGVVQPALQHWTWLYAQLKDWDSRVMLLSVLSYRTLGWRHVKMPLDTPAFWECLKQISDLEASGEKMPLDLQKCSPYPMSRFLLDGQDGTVDLYSDAFGVFNEFVYSQYNLRSRTKVYSAQRGDVVIDCGACFGGTSLYFADAVGSNGRVISFEFMPDNLKVFKANMAMNPELARRITLIERPVWKSTGDLMVIEGSGPATQVHLASAAIETPQLPGASEVRAMKIDDAMIQHDVNRVDLIKMDIEGAEMMALQGARLTIEKYRPCLAVCVYHKLIDFYEIPEFIHSLNLGYSFEFQHSTVHGDETVLFAVPDARPSSEPAAKRRFSSIFDGIRARGRG